LGLLLVITAVRSIFLAESDLQNLQQWEERCAQFAPQVLGIKPAGVMSIQRNDWSQMMEVVRSVDAE